MIYFCLENNLMGVEGLTTFLKTIFPNLPQEVVENVRIEELSGSSVVIDFSLIAFQFGSVVRGSIAEMNASCLRGIFGLLDTCLREGIKPLVVFDQAQRDLDVYGEGVHLVDEMKRTGEIISHPRLDALLRSNVPAAHVTSYSIPTAASVATPSTTPSTEAVTSVATPSTTPSTEAVTAVATPSTEVASTSIPTPSTTSTESVTSTQSTEVATPSTEAASADVTTPSFEEVHRQVVDFAMIMQAKSETRDARRDARNARKEATKQEQFFVSSGLTDVVELVCRTLGIATFRPMVEADWLMASLAKIESRHHPTYIMTEDTDLLLYDIGEAKVLRHYTINGQPKFSGTEYQCVNQTLIWRTLRLTDPMKRAYLAAILGCDYFDGVRMIGPKSVMHVFQIDPRYGRSSRIKTSSAKRLAPLIYRVPEAFREGAVHIDQRIAGLISSVEFAKHYISPMAFNGVKVETLQAWSLGTTSETLTDIPIEAIDDFLERVWTYRITGASAVNFYQAVLSFRNGPIIERHRIEAGDYHYSPESAPPTTTRDMKPEDKARLERLLHTILSDGQKLHDSIVAGALIRLGISLSIDEEARSFDALFD